MEIAEGRIRVVLVSPGDVAEERELAKRVVEELNRTFARGRLALWRWETDARPGLHPDGPQGAIDELMDVAAADLVVGVFWKRFGTPTHDADSGTEHELRAAWAVRRVQRRPEVMVYFSDRPYAPRTSAEATQWARVLQFREELPREQLWWTYTEPVDFERVLREHLTRYLQHVDGTGVSSRALRGCERVRFNLPEVTASFAGRERELGEIHAALGGDGRVVITQAITGLGGVGKSQVAARYVELHAEEYDIVAWIGAEDGGTKDLAGLGVELGLPTEALAPSDVARRALQQLAGTSLRWLLVLDNITSLEQISSLRPAGGEGRVLVTSRDRALRRFGRLITIDVFDEDTATAYVLDRADRRDDEPAARRLVRALGFLPLALSHAAAYCQFGTSFADYHALLEGLPAPELFDSRAQLSHERTVASTWQTSIQAAGGHAPLAPAVLEMAAYLAPDAMPKSLFAVLLDDDTLRSHKRLDDAFGALARYSLAVVDETTIGVHRLLQKTVRDAVTARADPSRGRLALRAVDAQFPQDADLPRSWPVCEQLHAHAHALAVTLPGPADEAARLVELLNAVCWYLHCAERGKRGEAAAQIAAACAERHLDAEHPARLRSRFYLARVFDAARQPSDAIAIYGPLLTDRERILGAEHPDTLTTRNAIAAAYRTAGSVDAAITMYQALLADRERTLGAKHPDTLSTQHSLAIAYRTAERPNDAIAIFEPLLAAHKEILGDEHPKALGTQHSLAIAYRAAGRLDDAIALCEAVLAGRRRILGGKHPDTLNTEQSLAIAYRAAGRIDDAVAIFEPLLAARKRILGAEHSDTLGTQHSLAITYRDGGRVVDAIAIFEPLLAARERILGVEHRDTLSTRQSLAITYRIVGRGADAIAIFEPLLTARERILGAKHPKTLATRNHLASAYDSAGRTADARLLLGRECGGPAPRSSDERRLA